MDLYQTLKHLFPSMVAGVDYRLEDSGAGPLIASWSNAQPKPTDAVLSAAWPMAQAAQQQLAVRAQRDSLVTATDWVVSRHIEQVAASGVTTIAPALYQQWLAYRQALRDITKQAGFPAAVAWPIAPASDSAAQT